MRAPQLVEMLAEAFGRERVLVHSEFHIQVVAGPKKHDIWVTRFGEIKWRLIGSRETVSGNPHKLIEKIQKHSPLQTDLAAMQGALSLSRSVSDAGEIAAQHNISRGIFCDAGFKDGRARISVVKIDGERVSADAMPVEAMDIHDAEKIAIEMAMEWFIDEAFLIYSDSKSNVDQMNNPRVKWIPRGQNKAADHLANLRRKTT